MKKAIDQAHKIINQLQTDKKEISHEHHGHLLLLVEYYEDLAKTWLGVLEQRSPIPFVWNEDQQKMVEDVLAYLENRAVAEMETVKHYIKSNEHFKGDIKHLIEEVNKTLHKGNEVVEQFRHNPTSAWVQVGELSTTIHMLTAANHELSEAPKGTDARKLIEKVEYLLQSLTKTLQHNGHSSFFF